MRFMKIQFVLPEKSLHFFKNSFIMYQISVLTN